MVFVTLQLLQEFKSVILFSFCVILLFFLVQYHWAKRKFYSLSANLPGPLSLPLIGNALKFCRDNKDIFDMIQKELNSYPSPMRLWIGPKLYVIFKEADDIQTLMKSSAFSNKDDNFYKFLKVIYGEGLITASGPKWKQDRKLLTPSFSSKNISRYYPIVLKESQVLVEKFEPLVGAKTFNVEKHVQRCITGMVFEMFSGVSYEAQNGKADQFLEALEEAYFIIQTRISKIWLHNDFIFRLTPYWKRQERFRKVLLGFLDEMLTSTRNNYENDDDQERCFIYEMLKIQQNIQEFATKEEMVHHLMTLFTATEDTTNAVSSALLVLFGMYQDIQEKVHQEINEVLEERQLQMSDLEKFKYLDMCIKDCMRLFPITPFIPRISSKDVRIGKILIPEGCNVMCATYNLHRNPKYWTKPQEFYPEHFSPSEETQRNPFAYIPFSAGPRSCIGKSLTSVIIKTLIITVLQNYKIEADGKVQDIIPRANINSRFKEDIYLIRIKKRN